MPCPYGGGGGGGAGPQLHAAYTGATRQDSIDTSQQGGTMARQNQVNYLQPSQPNKEEGPPQPPTRGCHPPRDTGPEDQAGTSAAPAAMPKTGKPPLTGPTKPTSPTGLGASSPQMKKAKQGQDQPQQPRLCKPSLPPSKTQPSSPGWGAYSPRMHQVRQGQCQHQQPRQHKTSPPPDSPTQPSQANNSTGPGAFSPWAPSTNKEREFKSYSCRQDSIQQGSPASPPPPQPVTEASPGWGALSPPGSQALQQAPNQGQPQQRSPHPTRETSQPRPLAASPGPGALSPSRPELGRHQGAWLLQPSRHPRVSSTVTKPLLTNIRQEKGASSPSRAVQPGLLNQAPHLQAKDTPPPEEHTGSPQPLRPPKGLKPLGEPGTVPINTKQLPVHGN